MWDGMKNSRWLSKPKTQYSTCNKYVELRGKHGRVKWHLVESASNFLKHRLCFSQCKCHNHVYIFSSTHMYTYSPVRVHVVSCVFNKWLWWLQATDQVNLENHQIHHHLVNVKETNKLINPFTSRSRKYSKWNLFLEDS